VSRRCGTLDLPIGGGRDYSGAAVLAQSLSSVYRLSPARAAHLVELYGSAASAVAEACGGGDDRCLDGSDYSRSEILCILREEQVETLTDLILRRTDLCIRGVLSMRQVNDLARILAEERGLSDEATRAEVASVLDELETWHGVTRAMLERRDGTGARE
jgi:glycerol-3-phosphate dehydrogenase